MKPKSFALILLICLATVQLAQAADVETFVSPDSGYQAMFDFLDGSGASIALATYTFSSPEIMDKLLEKRAEGVAVDVLVEKSPAGGVSDAEEAILCTLAGHGIPVHLYDGPARYMHAKYVIRDGSSVLVTSENMGTTGFSPGGDYGNRGWGAIVHDEPIAEALHAIFEEDKGFSLPFECGLDNFTVPRWGSGGGYRPVFGRELYYGQEVKLIAAPESLDGLLSLIVSANSSVSVEQYYAYQHWGSVKHDTVDTAPNPLLEALIDRARHGISVRVLLDSTYFNMDEEKGVSNLHTIAYLNSIGEGEGIPLEAKAIDLDKSGLAKAHNKGLVIDGETALVSSINWNENSVMSNREVGLLISGESAGYYARAFEHDWSGSGTGYGLGLVPAVASLALLIIVVAYFGRSRGHVGGRLRSRLSLSRNHF
ncbi:MAG: hypothetical protein JXC85_01100 [Candidatus Aenigmarchaeota archaeon]|nr:hypothetical protein [Candidatus Aenigmarchaeota archaeon]